MAYLLASLAALCWSGNHIIGRAMAGEVPPLAIGSIRWIMPAVLLALQRNWAVILALALGGGALFGTLQYVGLNYTTAINVSVLNSTAPVLIVAAGALLFRDRVSAVQLAGSLVSLAGVLAIVSKGSLAALAALSLNGGDLLILFNMGVWAVYSASLRKRGPMHWVTFTFVLSVISALATLPFWAWEHASGNTLRATTFTFASLAFVGVFPSLLAYATWSRAIEMIGSGRAGVFLHTIPLYSALVAGAALGERIAVYHLAGLGLILAGVALASRR
jgi:drug/metabolite transporter (DMT)-like permease